MEQEIIQINESEYNSILLQAVAVIEESEAAKKPREQAPEL